MASGQRSQPKGVVWDRRQQVAKLRLRGVRTVTAIAAELKVSHSTAWRDFCAVDEEFRRRAARNLETEKGLDLCRIDSLIEALWDGAVRGDLGSVKAVGDLMKQRAELLGLNAPTRLDLRLSRLSDEEIDQQFRRTLAEIQQTLALPEPDVIDVEAAAAEEEENDDE